MTIWWVPPWLINHGLVSSGVDIIIVPHRHRNLHQVAVVPPRPRWPRFPPAAAGPAQPQRCGPPSHAAPRRRASISGGKRWKDWMKTWKTSEKLGKDWEKHVFPEKCGWKIGKTPGKRMEKVDKTWENIWEKMGKESTQMGIIRCESLEGGKVFMWKNDATYDIHRSYLWLSFCLFYLVLFFRRFYK